MVSWVSAPTYLGNKHKPDSWWGLENKKKLDPVAKNPKLQLSEKKYNELSNIATTLTKVGNDNRIFHPVWLENANRNLNKGHRRDLNKNKQFFGQAGGEEEVVDKKQGTLLTKDLDENAFLGRKTLLGG